MAWLLRKQKAIKLFTNAVINYGGIPFELKVKQPNAMTAAEISELEAGQANSDKDVEELFDDLNIGKLNDV